MSMTYEEIRDLLTEKFSKEKKRLKTYGTKANSFDYANVIARYVEALMAKSRNRELRKFKRKILDKQPSQGDTGKIWDYIKERIQATSAMADVLNHVAEKNESERPYKRKEHKKHKHHHHRRHKK